MYTLVQALAMVAWIIFYVFYGKRFGLSKGKSLLLSLFSCLTAYFFILILCWVESGFREFGAQNAVRVFSVFIVFLWLESVIFKIDFRKNCDFQSIWPTLWFGLGHLACITEGCCNGFQYREGTLAYRIANTLTGTNMLPNQLFESLASLLIFVVLLLVLRKKNYNTGGRLFFVMLIVYGTQRFFWEFLRDNHKVIVFDRMPDALDGFLGLSSLSFWALAMVAEGIIVLVVFHFLDKKKKLQAAAPEV